MMGWVLYSKVRRVKKHKTNKSNCKVLNNSLKELVLKKRL